jgi:hypothetical protein
VWAVFDLGRQSVLAQCRNGVIEESVHPRFPRDQCAALVLATPATASAAPTVAQWNWFADIGAPAATTRQDEARSSSAPTFDPLFMGLSENDFAVMEVG